MRIEKVVLEKSAEGLLEKSEDCFGLAKTQQDLAEQLHTAATMQEVNATEQQKIAVAQHDNADKLNAKADKLITLGHALESDAVEIMGETMVVHPGRDTV
jgi:hypothetical protein